MDAQTEPQGRQRSPVLPIAIVVALLGAVSAGVIFVVSGASNSEFDPIEVAELAPADTHFFMAFNTDFASAPWAAMPSLLNRLGIEQEVRDDLADSAAEEDLDYDDDIVPVLGTIRRAGFAAQYTPDGDEWLIFIDSRDTEAVIALTVGTYDVVSEEEDPDLGIELTTYENPEDRSETPVVIAVHDDIAYFAESEQAITNFVSRRNNNESLATSQRFVDAIAQVQDDALLLGYLDGSLLDDREFREFIDAIQDSTGLDARDATVSFAVTAREIGFGSRVVVRIDSGFGSLAPSLSQSTDLAGVAAMTPEDAIFLFAGSGLHDTLVETLESAESDPLVDETLAPFEDLTGLSLREDLLPLFGSSYAVSAGGDGLTSGSMELDSVWVLGLIESGDPVRLSERLQLLKSELEFFICDCETGMVVSDRNGYVTVKWPDETLSDATLDADPAFISTLELLPPMPSNLFFINISALPEELLRETSAEWGADPDSYRIDLTAIPGFAAASYADENSISLDLVLPVSAVED